MFFSSMDINEVSIYNILIIIFVFLKDNYLPNSNLNDIYENSQIESFDDGNYNISNLNQSNCINIQDNDSKTKMQTNYKSNKLNFTNDFNIFCSNDICNGNNSYESATDKENKENKVREEKNINSNNKEDNYFSPEQILYLLENNEQFKIVIDFYKKDIIDEDTQKIMKPSFIGKKRKRRTASEIERDKIEMEKNKNKEVPKRGRKPKNDSNNNDSEERHSKLRPDNIMKKIKGKLFNYIINYINSLLTEKSKEYSLRILDYKFINQLKREVDLEYLKLPLKELFSKKISEKYNSVEKGINEINIKKILELEKDNVEINTALNMTFREWIDVFTMKKKPANNIQIYGIDKFLKEILEKNKEPRYFSLFVFCLYNYENWFTSKKGRNNLR